MGNKTPERIENQIVDFQKFIDDVKHLNELFQDRRFKRKIGFTIDLQIAVGQIKVTKLFKHSLWKKSRIAIVVATLRKIDEKENDSGIENSMLKSLISQMDETGEIKKKLSAKKFYYLYYQMTELIPLFSYLERLNFFRDSIQAMSSLADANESKFDKSIRLTAYKKHKTQDSEGKTSLSNDPSFENPIQVEQKNNQEIEKQQQKTKQDEEQNWECSICLDNLSDVMLPCTHSFCDDCIKLWQEKQNNCPMCRSDIMTQGQSVLGIQKQDEETYCIVNSSDNLAELSDEISMRVTGATQFIIDRKSFAKVLCTFQKIYTVEELIREGQNYKQMIKAEFS